MTIIHKGIRRKTTDVLDDYGQAHYLQNTRLRRVGEMGRRAGLGKSDMAQQAGPVQFMIGGWNYEPYIINGTGGTVTGNRNPLPKWGDIIIPRPDGQIGGQGCATGGRLTARYSATDATAPGGELLTGTVNVTQNCCYRVQHTISCTATRTYTGILQYAYSLIYTVNLSPTPGATCGAVTAQILKPVGPDTETNLSPNFEFVIDGYICSDATTLAAGMYISIVPTATPPGDPDRFDFLVSATTDITNIFCPACNP